MSAPIRAGVETIVFDELTGVPIVIGAPPSPTSDNCDGR